MLVDSLGFLGFTEIHPILVESTIAGPSDLAATTDAAVASAQAAAKKI